MSGLEPLLGAGLAAVGKAAPAAIGRIAATVGARVAKSSTLRWRVARRVRKRTGIPFSGKAFRGWLKRVSLSELHLPIGQAGPGLAVSLDAALSTERAWANHSDRHSRALHLVQETYLALVGLAPPADAATLTEAWAQARHDELVDRLVATIGSTPMLDHEDLGTYLLTQSRARTNRRLASFGIPAETVDDALRLLDGKVPNLESGHVLVVVGAFGAGKSELAEAWLRQRIAAYANGASTAIPVWLHASEIGTRSLEDVLVARHAGSARQPCALVVDGLDEVDSQVAARIADQASVLINSREGATALLTSRPSVLPESDEQQQWEGLPVDEARKLIESVSGKNHATWNWNPTLLESIRRPFFAIGAGILLADGARPSSQADLIRRLVERALAVPSSAHVAVQDSELFNLLVRTAVALTSSGGRSDDLSYQERQQLRMTRLIIASEGKVEFTLPIFQQWFAAQALLAQAALLRASIADAESFDRWRWPLAIAALSVTSADQFDKLAQSLLTSNPGAGAWVLDQVSSAREWPTRNENDFVDAGTAGKRILLATRTWIHATGFLAPGLFPIGDPGQPISLRVAVKGGTVSTVWDREIPPTDVVTDLGSNFRANNDHSWLEFSSGGAISGFEWPWSRQQDRIAKRMSKVLEGTYRLGPVDGVWHNESRYRLARVIANSKSIMFAPLNRQDVASSVHDLLAQVDDPLNVRWILDGEQIDGELMVDLASWLDGHEGDEIHRPLPAPDQDPRGGWVWNVYSDSRLQEFVAESYGQACVAYDEARATVLSGFTWSMGTAIPGEFGVVAILTPADPTGGWSGGPSLVKAVLPLSVVEDEAQRFREAAILSTNGRVVVMRRGEAGLPEGRQGEHDYFVDLVDRVGPAGIQAFSRRSIVNRLLDSTSHSRPASEIAAHWIWEDLKAVKLADGTGPRPR